MDFPALTFLERLYYNTGVKNPLIETSGWDIILYSSIQVYTVNIYHKFKSHSF